MVVVVEELVGAAVVVVVVEDLVGARLVVVIVEEVGGTVVVVEEVVGAIGVVVEEDVVGGAVVVIVEEEVVGAGVVEEEEDVDGAAVVVVVEDVVGAGVVEAEEDVVGTNATGVADVDEAVVDEPINVVVTVRVWVLVVEEVCGGSGIVVVVAGNDVAMVEEEVRAEVSAKLVKGMVVEDVVGRSVVVELVVGAAVVVVEVVVGGAVEDDEVVGAGVDVVDDDVVVGGAEVVDDEVVVNGQISQSVPLSISSGSMQSTLNISNLDISGRKVLSSIEMSSSFDANARGFFWLILTSTNSVLTVLNGSVPRGTSIRFAPVVRISLAAMLMAPVNEAEMDTGLDPCSTLGFFSSKKKTSLCSATISSWTVITSRPPACVHDPSRSNG
eukprot:552691-Rhodomonas_salina.1